MTTPTSPFRARGRPRIDLRQRTRAQQSMHVLLQVLATWGRENAQGVALGAKDTSLTYTALAGGDEPKRGLPHDRNEH